MTGIVTSSRNVASSVSSTLSPGHLTFTRSHVSQLTLQLSPVLTKLYSGSHYSRRHTHALHTERLVIRGGGVPVTRQVKVPANTDRSTHHQHSALAVEQCLFLSLSACQRHTQHVTVCQVHTHICRGAIRHILHTRRCLGGSGALRDEARVGGTQVSPPKPLAAVRRSTCRHPVSPSLPPAAPPAPHCQLPIST
ncbi:hypothetical protein E2C01_032284 [Portunus trituberculatus]|uniref:Uncharacterized protein n=1 Tax=Portunus trituberculatus TaxID=210409 RepID=A0A5B7EVM1_PORTR|nr:hypothetical protein [Portunus trituberculatus]